jgi:hypothetical protein
MVRGGSKAGGETALNELVCRDWRYDGGDGCKSSVIDRGCRLVLCDERRPHDVRNAAETGSLTIAERTARRDSARQRRKLELPLADHTSMRVYLHQMSAPTYGTHSMRGDRRPAP